MPFVVPGLSTSSSTTPTHTSSSSSSQDSVFEVSRYTQHAVPKRSGTTSDELLETRCINQQKPKTKIKMKDAKKYKAIYCMTCQTGCRTSKKKWSMKVVLQSHRETLRLKIMILPVLLMNCLWSREQKWNPGSSEHSVDTHFPKDPNCGICLKTKINEGFLQKTCWYILGQSGTFW